MSEFAPLTFVKDPDLALELQRAVESPEIDQGLIPFLKLFLDIPISPHGSCYGHFDKWGAYPYLSFSLDNVDGQNDGVRKQELFLQGIGTLQSRIDARLGPGAVEVVFEEEDRGVDASNDYTVQFNVKDGALFNAMGDEMFDVVWKEFTDMVQAIS